MEKQDPNHFNLSSQLAKLGKQTKIASPIAKSQLANDVHFSFKESIVCFIRISIDHADTLFVNESGIKLFGYNSKAEFQKNFKLDDHIISNVYKETIFNELKKNGFISGLQLRMIRRNKLFFWAELNGKLYFDKGYLELAIIDITENKRMEEVQRQYEQMLHSDKRTTPDIIYRLDTNGHITYINDAIKAYGYAPEELIGLKFTELIDDEDREKAQYRIGERRTGVRSTKSLEVRIKKKSSETEDDIVKKEKKKDEFISLVSAEGIYEYESPEKKNFIGTQGIVVDITGMKKAEMELIRAKEESEMSNQLKTKFLSNMSHNIRTPLNIIMGFANLLLKSKLDEKTHDYVTKIQSSGEDLLGLINNIIYYSMIETRQIHISLQTFFIADLIRMVESNFKALFEDKKVKFDIVIRKSVPERIHNDKTRIYQILSHLLSNALKFTEKGSVSMTLGYTMVNDTFTINLKDTGVGISEKNIDHIFFPFNQVPKPQDGDKSGTGLGLAISKNLVHLLEGHLSVKSVVGSGTEFNIVIPAHSEKIKDIASAQPPKDTFPESKEEKEKMINRNILIVEDNRINQILILEQFKKKGFKSIITAKDGQEAIDMALKHKPDIILMDIQMPGIDGNTAIKTLRDKKFDAPIIAVSAYDVKAEIERSMAAGADHYITKPIDFDTFFPQISNYLKDIPKRIKRVIHTPVLPDEPAPSLPKLKLKDSLSSNIKKVFITDAQEKLDEIVGILKEKGFDSGIDRFKAIAHEFKGNASYFGLDALESLAKEMDTGFKEKKKKEEMEKLTNQLIDMIKAIIEDNK